MKTEYRAEIAHDLSGISEGKFEIVRHNTMISENFPVNKISTQTSGKGKMDIYSPFSGVEISFNRYLADRVHFNHKSVDYILDIDHCRRGRIGWSMRGGISVYLGEGDLCLHTMDCCAHSVMTLPLGYYEGISVSINLMELSKTPPEIIKEAGIDVKNLYQKFCAECKPLAIPSNVAVDRIFAVLYELPEKLRVPYCKLKLQELLLYLDRMEPSEEKSLTHYVSQQTEQIREIHDFLIKNISRRFTIEELAKKYLINTSSLKSVFKAVYGMPVASYVKKYRIQHAMMLLKETDDSIAEIAKQVGYETQGKFTESFKEIAGIPPREYRRMFKK